MRKYQQGSMTRVTCDRYDVDRFCQAWPGSGFAWGDTCSFTFEWTGDLVDARYPRHADQAALVALAEDAQRYAGLE